jgi:hypothetical protein
MDDFILETEETGKGLVEVPDELVVHEEPPEKEETGELTPDVLFEQEKEDGDDEFTERTRQRLKKEKWKKHEAERQAETERKRADDLEARLAEYHRQLTELQAREQAFQQEKALAEVAEKRKELAGQIKTLRDVEHDQYDPDQAEALDFQLRELDAEAALLKRGIPKDAPKPAEKPQPQIPPALQKQYELEDQWIAEHPAYQTDAAYRNKVDSIRGKLIEEEGLRPDHPKLYQRITEAMTQKKAYAGPVGGPARGHEGRDETTQTDSRGRKFDMQTDGVVMRMRGKDPNDPKARAEYLRNQQYRT